jgi:hypothetical protein
VVHFEVVESEGEERKVRRETGRGRRQKEKIGLEEGKWGSRGLSDLRQNEEGS